VTKHLYVGTYDNGIQAVLLKPTSGQLSCQGEVAGPSNPSFLALGPDRKLLYAVSEDADTDGQPGGAVSCFMIKEDKLSLVNRQLTGGTHPCHLQLARDGSLLFAANYGSGSLSVFPLARDGQLLPRSQLIQHSGSGPNETRQEAPHTHSVNLSPDGRLLLVPDLGIDRIMLYDVVSGKDTISEHAPASINASAGSGPRHLAYSPDSTSIYLANELTSTLSVINVSDYSFRQNLTTLEEDFKGENTCAEVSAHPEGDFVYLSNRGADNIVTFCVGEENGELSLSGHTPSGGRTPRHFAIDPDGDFLVAANQDSDNLVPFRIDKKDGSLTQCGEAVNIPKPVCVCFGS